MPSARRRCFPVAAVTFAFLALAPGLTSAQDAEPDVPRRSATLPASFGFSAGDVLKLLFPDYVEASGRVPSIRDEEGAAAKVWISEAKPWKGDHLVLVVRIAADASEAATGLCGACLGRALLAVVQRKGDSVVRVAMGRPPKTLDDNEPDDVIGFGGHSSIALDLAPYALNKGEMLIGLRHDTIWREIRSNSLELYRIEDGRLNVVFQTLVADFEYPGYPEMPRAIVKTIAIIEPQPSSQKYYDLRVTRTVNRCTDRNEDDDCDPKHEPVRRIRTTTERWQFDGAAYQRTKEN